MADFLLIDTCNCDDYAIVGRLSLDKQMMRVRGQTSRSDGFSNVFLQAWRSGSQLVRLVIDLDTLIVQKGLGMVSGNMERVIRDIRPLLADPALRERLTTNCIEYVRRHHADEVLARQYMDVFQSLSSNGRR